MGGMDASDQWLIRSPQNFIKGPYSREQICKQIEDGTLTSQDEVCKANHYWFYLHETEEVLKNLGVNPPKPLMDPEQEITQTDNSIVLPRSDSHPGGSLADDDEGTAILSHGRIRKGDSQNTKKGEQKKNQPPQPEKEKDLSSLSPLHEEETPALLRQIEKVSFWKALATFLVFILSALLVAIFRVVRNV